MSTRYWLMIWMMTAVAGCATHQERCNGRLRPINVPIGHAQASPGIAQ
jgi:hypothetical protein